VTNVDFALTNIKGQTFLQQKLSAFAGEAKTTITLPKLPSGIYFARFTTINRTVIKKVVIQQ
jgi:hypothetical protein